MYLVTCFSSCLRGPIGQRVRLLTERLVVQAHPGTIFRLVFQFKGFKRAIFFNIFRVLINFNGSALPH